jgi:hypothetical protein
MLGPREDHAMAHIVLTDEQLRGIPSGTRSIEVRDSRNNFIGYLRLPSATPDEIAEALRRFNSPERRYSSEEVRAFLRSLESK